MSGWKQCTFLTCLVLYTPLVPTSVIPPCRKQRCYWYPHLLATTYLCKVFHDNIMSSSSRWKYYILVPIVLTVIRQLIIYLQGKLPTTPGPLIACLLIVREAESPIFYFSLFFRSVRSFAKSGIKIEKYF